MAKLRNNIIAALDVGSTKIACFIARPDASGAVQVIGIGHQVSHGVKSGVITHIKQAEEAIRAAVGTAEQMAGVNIDSVVVNISGSQKTSHIVNVEMPLAGQEVTEREVMRLIEEGCAQFRSADREIIHCVPIDYAIDGAWGIKDPKGMFCKTLGMTLHVVTVSSTALYNLANCLARCHLDVADYIVSPYASALACLHEDEKDLGVILIDFGGGNTSFSVFTGGAMVYTDTVPLGGMHITNDIAVGLSTNLVSAERIKTLYGHVLNFTKGDQDFIDIPLIDEEGDSNTEHIQRSTLVGVIKPRVDEILEMVKERLDTSGFADVAGRIKITGGASQLGGLKEYAQKFFGKSVKEALPVVVEGMAESTKGPAFSTCVGVLKFAVEAIQRDTLGFAKKSIALHNSFAVLVRWFRENF